MIWIPTLVFAVGAMTPRLQELQPKTYTSPSGRWTLRVEPTERSGTSEADDTLIGGEREAWHARHPFALWDAIVTDDGRVAGVAYSGRGPESWSDGGTLRVVVLAPTGEVLLDEAHERQRSHIEHTAAWPRVAGLFAQPELGRVVVRVVVEEIQEGGSSKWYEEWWSYALASGEPGKRERPKEKLGLTSPFLRLYAARPIPGTSLVLLHWPKDEWEKTPRERGALFQLVDPSWHVAWSLVWPHDYDADDPEARMRIQNELRQQGGAILATGPRRFELRQVAENRRVAFAVEPADAAATRWSVKEASSTTYGDGAAPPPSELPARTLELVERVPLGNASAPGAEIRDIRAFGFDERSRLRFVRGEEGTSAVTLVRLDETGAVLRATRAAPAEEKARLAWFALPRERWIAAADADGERPIARLWLVAEADGRVTELAGFTGQRVGRVDALGVDTFLVFGTWQTTFALDEALVALDSSGHVLWRYPETPGEISFINDVAVLADGRIAAVETIRKSLALLSASGAELETLELAEVWGHEPRYPCVLAPDRDGGVLVYDSSGSPPLYRTELDGTLRASFDVRRADGTVLDECRDAVHVAPDGRMWTTDRHEFLRLDEAGRVDLELGSAERVELLEEPGFASVDSLRGRILVHDVRTRTLHVFDREGLRMTIGRPKAEEREDLRFPLIAALAPDGSVLVGESQFAKKYVCFASDGSSRGRQDLGVSNLVFELEGGAYWGVGADAALERHSADGTTTARVEKLPDGRWFRSIRDIAVAADGSLAVLDLATTDALRRKPGDACLALFAPDGAPVRSFTLPPVVQAVFVSYQDERVLLAGWKEAWLLDVTDGTVTALTLAEEARAFGLSPDGTELWAIAKDGRSFARYRLD